MPLAFATIGVEVKIIKVLIEDLNTKRHMENLGILVGADITPVTTSMGDLILKVKDGRLAINKGLAMKILVE